MESCVLILQLSKLPTLDSFFSCLLVTTKSFPLLGFIVYAGLNNNKDVRVKAAGA